jgi:hypothetical protein
MGSVIEEILSGEKINCDSATHYRNYVILFWSPSDIRGIRMASYFSGRKKEFHDKGLGIIGIVVPETGPEKKMEYILGILKQYKIDICCVVDNELYLWAYFNNQFLPNLIVMDDEDNMLEESSGADNISSVEDEIAEITGIRETSLGDFWKVHFVDMKYSLEPGDFKGNPDFRKDVYPEVPGSVTISGSWTLGDDGFPVCQGACKISVDGEFEEIYLALETCKEDRLVYESGGWSRELEIEGFNLVKLYADKNQGLKTMEIKIGKGVRIYSIQF